MKQSKSRSSDSKSLAWEGHTQKDGFPFAVQAGADFIAVGMFDFQVAENVETAKKVFQ